MAVLEFNAEEKPGDVVARLARESEADIVVALDCASARVPFAVLGFFVIPRSAMKLPPDHHGA